MATRSLCVMFILTAATAARADQATDRAWLGVKEWRATIEVRVDDTSAGNGVTTTTKSFYRATVSPMSLDASVSDHRSSVWTGRPKGTMGVNTKSTAPGPTISTWIASGAIPADAELKLTIDLDKHTYEIHSFSSAVTGTLTQVIVPYNVRETHEDVMDVGSFTRTFPLPAGGPRKLEQRFACTFAECAVDGAGGIELHKKPVSVHVTIEPNTRLAAVPGGPYSVERGKVVDLDGSRSGGAITRHTWKVTPGRCPDGTRAPAKQRDGATWSFTALCPATATITVTDGSKTDSKTVPIAVTARTSFVTQFSEAPQEVPLDGAAPMVGGSYPGGENRCARDPDSPHLLHPRDRDHSWDGTGYTLAQINDDGPFKSYWYVATEALEVARQIAINKYLLPGGPKIFRDLAPFYEHNGAAKMKPYLDAIRAHERLHSRKMKEGLARGPDPATKLEAMISAGDRDSLKRKADLEIKKAEVRMCRATKDPLDDPEKRFKLEFPIATRSQWEAVEFTVGGPTDGRRPPGAPDPCQ